MKDKMVAAKADFRELLKVPQSFSICFSRYAFNTVQMSSSLNSAGEQVYYLQDAQEPARFRAGSQ